MSLWLPLDGPVPVKRNVAPVTGGTHVAGAVIKLLMHSTEGSSFTPSSSKYFGHTGWPHLTCERDGTLWQHIDLDLAARALKNLAGGVQTNRGGPVQVENVAFSRDGDQALTDAQIASNRWLAGFLHTHRGLELKAAPPWVVPGSARADAPQRIPAHLWYQTGGVIAHAHATENDHWDVPFRLARILPVLEDDMNIRIGHRDSGDDTAVRDLEELVNNFAVATGSSAPIIDEDGVWTQADADTFSAHVVGRLRNAAFHQLAGLTIGKHASGRSVSPSIVAVLAAVLSERR